MSADHLIVDLEAYWNDGSLLEAARHGIFRADEADTFLELLRSIAIGDHELVPKRLLSLLWYLPLFLEWQKERVSEVSPGHIIDYVRFVTEVINILEGVLGVP